MAHSKWLQFTERGLQDEKRSWSVFAGGKLAWLGNIAWFGRWRRYVFFPQQGMLFDAACLRELAEFMESQTQAEASGSPVQREG